MGWKQAAKIVAGVVLAGVAALFLVVIREFGHFSDDIENFDREETDGHEPDGKHD